MSVRLNSPDELLLSLTVCLDVMLWHLQSYSFLLVGSTKMWKISHLFAVRLGWSVWKSVAESKHTTSSRLILCLIMKPKYIKKYLYLILPHHSISQESIVLFISLLIKKVHQWFFFFFSHGFWTPKRWIFTSRDWTWANFSKYKRLEKTTESRFVEKDSVSFLSH